MSIFSDKLKEDEIDELKARVIELEKEVDYWIEQYDHLENKMIYTASSLKSALNLLNETYEDVSQ